MRTAFFILHPSALIPACAQGLTYAAWPLGLFAAVYAVIYPWRYRTHVGKLMKKLLAEGENKGLIGPRRLSITPESLNGATAFGESVTKWTAVEKIVVVEEYAYIHTGAMSAFIIPKRAFADDRAFQTFVETAERYRHEAS
jgi:hypothetical protein